MAAIKLLIRCPFQRSLSAPPRSFMWTGPDGSMAIVSVPAGAGAAFFLVMIAECRKGKGRMLPAGLGQTSSFLHISKRLSETLRHNKTGWTQSSGHLGWSNLAVSDAGTAHDRNERHRSFSSIAGERSRA